MITLSALALLGCSTVVKPDEVDEPVPTETVEEEPPTPYVPTPPPPTPDPVDADGDGYDETEDCDDFNPARNPGQGEICDGIDNDCDGIVPVEEQDLDGDGTIDCAETSCDVPEQAPVSVLPSCEFQPNVAGTPFHARIEWSMSHEMVDPSTGATVAAYAYAEFPDYHESMHAPVVYQATDDDGNGTIGSEDVPDIAVVMGVDDPTLDGVLRVISGDGGGVHASIHTAPFTNLNGTHEYAPYHYAGLAMANIDDDVFAEVVTLVRRQGDGACYPAVYEVGGAPGNVQLELERVFGGDAYTCTSHAPAIADIDGDGEVEVIFGRAVMDSDLELEWVGSGGRGWYHQDLYADGYWNSGAHSFAYDMDGDGLAMEVVAGSTIYNPDGSLYCELGEYVGGTWSPALDGYPSVADVMRFSGDTVGEPEVVLTGNEFVSVFHGAPHYDPNGAPRCLLVDQIPNDPALSVPNLPDNPNCVDDRPARGGPSTIADFDGDGSVEIAVAGACWYNVYRTLPNNTLDFYAMAPTTDWSSASTGSTVFDFNGDDAAEVVFSDEEALYVWSVNTIGGLEPWQRLEPLLVDENHKSWTIHEYPLVADVDADGKAEIVMVNASNPTWTDRYGIYVLGSADDDWVTAGQTWNQHAFHITNVDSNGHLGYAEPNYAPYSSDDFNSFRQQRPGDFGVLEAPNLFPEVSTCQANCGEIEIYVQVGNNGPHISVEPSVVVSLYGITAGQRTLIEHRPLGQYVHPGALSDGYTFFLDDWSAWDHVVAVVDDPAFGPVGSDGQANECFEGDNEVLLSTASWCL